MYVYLTTLSVARVALRVFVGWLTTCEFYYVDMRDKEVATACFEALSRHALERAVENEANLRTIFVPADKASVISSIIIIIIKLKIIIIVIISFTQGIYTYIPETNYVPREYSVAAILLLLFMVLISLVAVLNLLYFYISTYRSMCAVPNMAVFCSSLTSCFPSMLLTYFLNEFEIVPVAPIITGITFVFTFHMRVLLLLLLLLLLTAIALSSGSNGYFICIQNMKLITNKLKSVLILPFYHFTIIPFYHFTILPFYHFTVLFHCFNLKQEVSHFMMG